MSWAVSSGDTLLTDTLPQYVYKWLAVGKLLGRSFSGYLRRFMSLRILPLGGLGEIGMNCLALEHPGGILLVDCGTAFPYEDLGIDVYHADFSWLRENAERVSGVFITHGHEDHIGGLPYLLEDFEVPVFGPPHALRLARRRLDEHEFRPHELDLREVSAGTVTHVGPFSVEPVRVSHSIVEASALRITTDAGVVVHTGDFNMDPDPPDGEPTDVARLAAIGADGVDLLLSDSTNVDTAERSGSERAVGAALERIVEGASELVAVAMFASNVQRLILLGEIAARTGRKILLLGRSLRSQRDVATDIGRLRWPSNLVVSPDQARDMPRRELLVLAGGTQAEPNSAMARLAAGAHGQLELAPGDTVVFSSRVIPGNERPVAALMNDLLRRDVLLHTVHTDPDIHTSGHGGRSEQRRMIELLRPRSFVPVHGTLRHLRRHAELARELGIRDVMVIENGSALAFDRERGLSRDGGIPHGRVAVAPGGEPLEDDVLRRRAELGRSGVVTLFLTLDGDGEPVGPPSIVARGVPGVDDDESSARDIARGVQKALERARGFTGVDLADEARRAVRRSINEISGARPVVEVRLLRR